MSTRAFFTGCFVICVFLGIGVIAIANAPPPAETQLDRIELKVNWLIRNEVKKAAQ